MSNHGIIVREYAGIKPGTFVKYRNRTIIHEQVEHKVTDALMYVMSIPEPDRIRDMLNEVCSTYALHYNPRDNMFRLTGFSFGNLISERVPVYSQGEKTGTRLAVYTKHITVRSASMNDCFRRIFRQIAMKRLYSLNSDSELLNAITWNEDHDRFDVEEVLKGVAAQIGKGKMA